jgi:hypothetical protein
MHEKPVLKFQGCLTDGTTLHGGDEIQHIAADPAAPRRNARIGMAGPGILVGIDDEALATAFRSMRWQWAAPPKVGVVESVEP